MLTLHLPRTLRLTLTLPLTLTYHSRTASMGAGVTEEQFTGMSALVEGDLADAVGSESYRRR